MFYENILAIPPAHLIYFLYFFAPALLGLLNHHKVKIILAIKNIMARGDKSLKWLNTRKKLMTKEDWFVFTISILILSILILSGLQHLTQAVSSYVAWLAILLLAASFLMLAATRYRLVEIYKQTSWLINLVLFVIGLYIANESTKICDTTIAGFTNMSANSFPAAQRALTSLINIFYWIYLSTIVGLAVCVLLMITCASSYLKAVSNSKSSAKNETKSITKNHKESKSARHTPRGAFALLISLFYIIIAITTYATTITTNKTNAMVKNILVDYSFQVSPTACGLSAPPNSAVSLLGDKQAVLAIPDQKETYRFIAFECNRNFNKYPEIQSDLTSTFKIADHQP